MRYFLLFIITLFAKNIFPQKQIEYKVANNEADTMQITMTTTRQNVWVTLAGSGLVTIDWGDGNIHRMERIDNSWGRREYNYNSSASRTITIIGKNITGLRVENDNGLTDIDVSKCISLEVLWCHGNNLTTLDVSKNTMLISLNCSQNKLTALNVSNNTDLTLLNCGYNRLTALNVNNNAELRVD